MVAFSLPSCRWRSLERMKCPSGVLGQFGQIQEWPNIDWTTNIDDWMVTGQARLPIPSHTLGRLSGMSACTDPCYICVLGRYCADRTSNHCGNSSSTLSSSGKPQVKNINGEVSPRTLVFGIVPICPVSYMWKFWQIACRFSQFMRR